MGILLSYCRANDNSIVLSETHLDSEQSGTKISTFLFSVLHPDYPVPYPKGSAIFQNLEWFAEGSTLTAKATQSCENAPNSQYKVVYEMPSFLEPCVYYDSVRVFAEAFVIPMTGSCDESKDPTKTPFWFVELLQLLRSNLHKPYRFLLTYLNDRFL